MLVIKVVLYWKPLNVITRMLIFLITLTDSFDLLILMK